jgi:glycosidase
MRFRPFLALLATLAVTVSCAVAPPIHGPSLAHDRYEFTARTALYEVFVRDFSPEGNFQGLVDGLDRIEAVGAEVVWLMPIHPIGEIDRKGPQGSPYSVTDYRGIHPDFGDEEDFRALVRAVQARGMKLILDWVANHTAWDHEWVTRYPERYARDEAGAMTVPRDEDGDLTDWTDVVELDYGNPDLRRAMIAEMLYWIEEFGIDGFRVDVAGMVPDDFWREAIPRLRAVRPLLLLAEWGDPRMHAVGFDLTYPWGSYHRLKEVWRGEPAAGFVDAEIQELATLPEGGLRMRFTTNHDETAWDEPPVLLFGGPAGARAAFVAMALLPGPPLIYNGQEVESPQELGLFVREPIEWDQPGADDARAFYRHVIHLSRTHDDLALAPLAAVQTDASDDVIAYRRGNVVVVVNARDGPVRVTLVDVDLAGGRDLLTGRTAQPGALPLPPYGTLVVELTRSRSRSRRRPPPGARSRPGPGAGPVAPPALPPAAPLRATGT